MYSLEKKNQTYYLGICTYILSLDPYVHLSQSALYASKVVIIIKFGGVIIVNVVHSKTQLLHHLKLIGDLNGLHKLRIWVVFDLLCPRILCKREKYYTRRY